MGEVSHVVGGVVADSKQQFHSARAYYDPLGLDRYRNEHEINLLVGIQHAECEQYAVNGTRSSYHRTVDEHVDASHRGVDKVIAILKVVPAHVDYLLIIFR